MMYLDDEPPTTGGREIWGFPKKYGLPRLKTIHETLTGTLHYDDERVALGTMVYKQTPLDHGEDGGGHEEAEREPEIHSRMWMERRRSRSWSGIIWKISI